MSKSKADEAKSTEKKIAKKGSGSKDEKPS